LELLIVATLISILFVLFYGSGTRRHQQSQKKACQKNLLKLHIALEIFANDHEGSFPVLPGAQTAEEPLALLVPRYTVDSGSFICPGSKDAPIASGAPIAGGKISYAYFMGRRLMDSQELLLTDRQIDTRPKNAGQNVFSTTGKPPGNNHRQYGGNYLFADGHLEMSSVTAPFPLVWTQNVVLLNPKP
jgi:prepilin-type processing-associated H-X9-DG protein